MIGLRPGAGLLARVPHSLNYFKIFATVWRLILRLPVEVDKTIATMLLAFEGSEICLMFTSSGV